MDSADGLWYNNTRINSKGGKGVKAEQYQRWSAPFRGKNARVIPTVDKVLTAAVYITYPLLLLLAWRQSAAVLWRTVWVPASWLVLVSLVRRLDNRPRPYERMAIAPLIKKHTKGRSCPSRHAFSVWMIAVTAWWLLPPLGAVISTLGVLLCVTRVLGGVHDEWDVIIGAVIGVAAGILGYWAL